MVRVVLFLIALSIAAVVFQNSTFYRTLRLDNSELFIAVPADDRSSGGRSKAKIIKKDGKTSLDCKIIHSDYGWPYCEVRFNYVASDPTKPGIDLSDYTEIEIAARYRSDKNNNEQSVRFQMRNFNERYSRDGYEETYKYNAIEYRFSDAAYPSIIPLERLQVYSWWIAENRVPMDLQNIEITNVRFIELATGNYMPQGRYFIDIEHIKLRGKWIKDEIAYLAVILLWVVSATIWLMIKLVQARQHVAQLRRKQKELKIINKLLDSKSQELEDKANRDPLTGALNRAGLDHFLKTNELLLSLEVDLSVLYLDMDHFKRVNDDCGHDVGDAVLVRFVQVINEHTRDSDLLVRWGGEEFLLLLPNTSLLRAQHLAESLRHTVAMANWPNNLTLTMSVGVAMQQEHEAISACLKRADEALYLAKEKGRNRIEIAN